MADEFNEGEFKKFSAEFDPAEFEQFGKDRSWGDVPGQAIKNLGPSALQFGKDIIHPFIHPIETAESLKNIGHGLLQKSGVVSGDEYEKYPNALGEFFSERYGGMDNLKKTMATDPVGFLSDLSLVLTGGGAVAAKAPGVMGRVGELTKATGRVIDPINMAAQTARGAGYAATGLVGGLGTHTGGESLRIAATAGYEGAPQAKALRENMRGTEELGSTVEAATKGIEGIKRERDLAYRSGMAGLGDPTVLDFTDIDRAVAQANKIGTYKGQVLSEGAEKIRSEMVKKIDDWKNLDWERFHTAEGFDALKRSLGETMSAAKTPMERKIAGEIYNSVKDTIVKQAPQYAKIMEGYENASSLVREIEKALSLPSGDRRKGPTIDTSLRKLQAVLRNNVNSSYAHRRNLAQYLVDNGSPQLMERLAGQALSSWIPRGLGKLGAQIMMEALIIGLGHASGGISHAVTYGAAALPFMSPRLMGETSYLAGRAATPLRYVKPRPRASYQIGRATRVSGDGDGSDAEAEFQRMYSSAKRNLGVE